MLNNSYRYKRNNAFKNEFIDENSKWINDVARSRGYEPIDFNSFETKSETNDEINTERLDKLREELKRKLVKRSITVDDYQVSLEKIRELAERKSFTGNARLDPSKINIWKLYRAVINLEKEINRLLLVRSCNYDETINIYINKVNDMEHTISELTDRIDTFVPGSSSGIDGSELISRIERYELDVNRLKALL